MIRFGLTQCLQEWSQLYSEKTMGEVRSGRRALMGSLFSYKNYLTTQVERKGECGFYLAKVNYIPAFFLFNKKFDSNLREKIDLM
jgi:hypothetical protein